jgi:hypothetical protein
VEPKSVVIGGTATVTYKVENATKVMLEPLGVDLAVSGQDSYSFIAEAPGKMTLVLTAYNAQNQAVKKEVSFTVVDQSEARILVFRAMKDGAPISETELEPGTPIQIEWQVTNAARIEVAPPIGIASDRGTLELIAPAETTTYTLTATDAKGRKVVGKVVLKIVKPESVPPPMGPGGG